MRLVRRESLGVSTNRISCTSASSSSMISSSTSLARSVSDSTYDHARVGPAHRTSALRRADVICKWDFKVVPRIIFRNATADKGKWKVFFPPSLILLFSSFFSFWVSFWWGPNRGACADHFPRLFCFAYWHFCSQSRPNPAFRKYMCTQKVVTTFFVRFKHEQKNSVE